MRDRARWLLLTPLVAMGLAGGCGGGGGGAVSPPPGSVPKTIITLQSDPGESIGLGKSYRYTQADSIIRVTASGSHLEVHVDGDEHWTGEFQTPDVFASIYPGNYANLQLYPDITGRTGALDWNGEGRGSSTVTGSFVVNTAHYGANGLDLVDLTFELHSENRAPALRGTIHWEAGDTTQPPEPVSPPPGGLWQPPFGGGAPSGDYIYLQSDTGDFVGAGHTFVYTRSNAQVSFTYADGHLHCDVNIGGVFWMGDFQSMTGTLLPGYYGGLERYPFNNPAKGGLDFGGGYGCNTLTGWFVVDNVTYSGNQLTSIDLRFEQHCEAQPPALHGKIHWHL